MKRFNFNKAISWILILALSATVSACAKPKHPHAVQYVDETKRSANHSENAVNTDPDDTSGGIGNDDVAEMTMFTAVPIPELEKTDDNDIEALIAEKTGVRINEMWLEPSQLPSEAIGAMVENGSLPDFINGMDSNYDLYENGYLVAWDEYIEANPNLKELYTEEEWNRFRQADGKIYWANVFGNNYKTDTSTNHDGMAFWIQARVLEAYGYPKISTLDEYFELLEKFAAEYPELPDGTPVIPYTCLCEDWRSFSLESPPILLAGYADDQYVAIDVDPADPTAPKVFDYNLSPSTERYFRKLNEEYNKGVIDPDFAVQTFEEYIKKLSTGAVLGIADQYWNFEYLIMDSFSVERVGTGGSKYRLDELGCNYVPLGLTIEPDMAQHYHSYTDEINTYSGIAVTTSCKDPDRAFAFLNALLDQDIHDFRFWGIEGLDYLVDDNGLYYRTEEMRDNWRNPEYLAQHACSYSYMPQWRGMSRDGVNRMMPEEQPGEYLATLPKPVADCFTAYGASNYVDMLGSEKKPDYPWFPMSSWFNNLRVGTAEYDTYWGVVMLHREWYPKLVMSTDFEADWATYADNYGKIDTKTFFDAAQAELDRRVQIAKDNGWSG